MDNIEITIDGLNERQRVLADIIWAFDERKDIDRFIKTLPTKELRNEANSILELIVMASVEQLYDGISDDAEAKSFMDKIFKNG